jgi:hypothetical protein
MFEELLRKRARFESVQGPLSTEDLWTLPLTTTAKNKASLDDIARTLSKKIKDTETESFVSDKPQSDALDQLQFEYVKHVITVKKAENAAAAAAVAQREELNKLTGILARKHEAALDNLSIEELEARIAAAKAK